MIPDDIPHELGILGKYSREDREEFYKNRICAPTPDEYALRLGRVQFLAAYHSKEVYSTILDIGCHDGFSTRWMLKDPRVNLVHGVDLCEAAIAEAHKAIENYAEEHKNKALYELTSWESINYTEFDAVVCFEVIEHFHMDEVHKLLQVIDDSLNPLSGRAFISTPDRDGPWGLANDVEREHITLFTPQMLIDTIKETVGKDVEEMIVHDGLILTTWSVG